MCFAQTTSFCNKAQKLTGTFNLYHFNPPALNENTSAEVIDLFITNLDNRARILKGSDCRLLKENATQLFNQVNSNSNAYPEKAIKIYLKALQTADSIVTELAAKKLNFKESDTIYLLPIDSKKIIYAPSLKAYAKKLERYVKWKSYESVTATDSYEKLTEEEFNLKTLASSKTIIAGLQKNISSEIKNVDSYVGSTLLNAIALRYDPHSNYFTNEQNEEFNTQLSSQINSFGFYLDENEAGGIIIGQMEPGGSAWMSNEINEGDIFISVKINNEKITAEGSDAYEIQSRIDKTDDAISLTVKKPNGLLKSVTLIKQKTASTDNVVKGYVLSGAHSKTGYISLPSFYTDMEEHNLPGCANDVAKEILKLTNDSINGLILDLRNNGGGSMEEAMNLAGIFIDEGPLFIMKDKNKKPTLVKDINRGSIFKKPIVVLINEASASASELFANIVKDYNLGAVVGQQSYGKGTAQNVLPLDTNLLMNPNKNAKDNSDFIKITMSKFYRLNNSTHQGTGVLPDVILPPTPGYSEIKESKELYYLLPDSIVKKVVYTPKPKINFQPLRDNSSKRLSLSKEFIHYRQLSDSVSTAISKTYTVVLKFNEYKKFKKETDRMYASVENAFETTSPAFTCINNSFDLKLDQVNETTRQFNSKILQSIQKDIFINESFSILNDLINQQPK